VPCVLGPLRSDEAVRAALLSPDSSNARFGQARGITCTVSERRSLFSPVVPHSMDPSPVVVESCPSVSSSSDAGSYMTCNI